MERADKNTRILKLYDRLLSGKTVNKTLFSLECNVSERAFDRDVEDIRLYLSEEFSPMELIFDKSKNGYYLTVERRRDLLADELLPILKILLGIEVFRSDEMREISETLMSFIDRKDVSKVKISIAEELANYQPQPDKTVLLKMVWDLSECIYRKTKIKIRYQIAGQAENFIIVSPVSVVFAENGFYLAAFTEGSDNEYPTFYQVDKIDSFEVLGQAVFIKSTQICDIDKIKCYFKQTKK